MYRIPPMCTLTYTHTQHTQYYAPSCPPVKSEIQTAYFILFLDTWFRYVVLASLKLPVETRLASETQNSAYLKCQY